MTLSLSANRIPYFRCQANINITNTIIYTNLREERGPVNVTLYIAKGSGIDQRFPVGVINAETAIQLK